jgi:hypothetical protein
MPAALLVKGYQKAYHLPAAVVNMCSAVVEGALNEYVCQNIHDIFL